MQRRELGGVGRTSTLPLNATESERGCVVLDQPQHVGRASTSDLFQSPLMTKLLRLVFDTAALGQFRDAPAKF